MATVHGKYLSYSALSVGIVVWLSGLGTSLPAPAEQKPALAQANKLAGIHVLANLPMLHPQVVTIEGAGVSWDFGFSSDGLFIASSFSSVIDVKAGRPINLSLPDKIRKNFDFLHTSGLAISPCGKYLLVGGSRGNVYHWNINEGKFKGGLIATANEANLKDSVMVGSKVLRLRFARSGHYLVARCGNGSIYVYSWPTLRWIDTLSDRGGISCSVDISDDGRYVVTGCAGDPALLWEMHEEQGAGAPTAISPAGLTSNFVTISRSGSMVAYAGLECWALTVIETYSKGHRARLRPSVRLVGPLHLAFSADGRLLVMSGQGGVSVLDLARGEEVIFFDAEEARADIVPRTQDLLILADKVYIIPAGLYLRKWTDIREKPLSADQMDRLLATLAVENAKHAFEAMTKLMGQVDSAVAELGKRLQPVLPISDELGRQLLDQMASNDPDARERATREMQSYGLRALEVVRQASQQHPEIEVRRRCQHLLRSLDTDHRLSLFERRALEVLESLATPAAVELLKKLSAGVPMAPLTHEAKRTLQRLSWRSVPVP